MREINASWMGDEMGSARMVFLRPTPWMEAVVVVDNLALGPAVGGVRQTPAVSPAQALATIEEKIRSNTTELMDRVTHDGCLPRKAAIDMAMARIRAAEAYRRRF